MKSTGVLETFYPIGKYENVGCKLSSELNFSKSFTSDMKRRFEFLSPSRCYKRRRINNDNKSEHIETNSRAVDMDLFTAVESGNISTLANVLSTYTIDVNLKNADSGRTAIYGCDGTKHGHYAMLQMLVDNGAR